ncbi:uncharacterized protein LOC128659680 [Bombina bombina]|uniref:uncharacterized protein LOC128659680 n=1 Tax=Bombina bombina TaxID=8345 RepID=UPI00235B1D3F|nr:uncharacterized protein LOC128659680 [Bombina bombina]
MQNMERIPTSCESMVTMTTRLTTPDSFNQGPLGHSKPSELGQYLCIECNEAFDTKQELSVHKQIHVIQKPFTCSHCGRGFHHQIFLEMHEKNHEGERPHTPKSVAVSKPSAAQGMSTRSRKAVTSCLSDSVEVNPSTTKNDHLINTIVKFKKEKQMCPALVPRECVTRLGYARVPPRQRRDVIEKRTPFELRVSKFSNTTIHLIDAFGNSLELLTEVFNTYTDSDPEQGYNKDMLGGPSAGEQKAREDGIFNKESDQLYPGNKEQTSSKDFTTQQADLETLSSPRETSDLCEDIIKSSASESGLHEGKGFEDDKVEPLTESFKLELSSEKSATDLEDSIKSIELEDTSICKPCPDQPACNMERIDYSKGVLSDNLLNILNVEFPESAVEERPVIPGSDSKSPRNSQNSLLENTICDIDNKAKEREILTDGVQEKGEECIASLAEDCSQKEARDMLEIAVTECMEVDEPTASNDVGVDGAISPYPNDRSEKLCDNQMPPLNNVKVNSAAGKKQDVPLSEEPDVSDTSHSNMVSLIKSDVVKTGEDQSILNKIDSDLSFKELSQSQTAVNADTDNPAEGSLPDTNCDNEIKLNLLEPVTVSEITEPSDSFVDLAVHDQNSPVTCDFKGSDSDPVREKTMNLTATGTSSGKNDSLLDCQKMSTETLLQRELLCKLGVDDQAVTHVKDGNRLSPRQYDDQMVNHESYATMIDISSGSNGTDFHQVQDMSLLTTYAMTEGEEELQATSSKNSVSDGDQIDGSDVKQDAGSPNSDTQTLKSVSENISSTNLSEKNVLGQSMSETNSDLFLASSDGHTIDNKINQESIHNVTLTGQAKPAEENLHMQVISSEREDGSDVKQDAVSPNSDTQTVKSVSENISSTNLSEKNVLGQSMSDKNSDLFLVPIDGHTIDNKINQESIDNVALTGQAKPAEENLHMQVISSEREDGSDVKQDAGSPNSDTQTVKSVSENISSTNLSEKNVLGQSMSDKNSDLFLVPIDGHTIDNKINQESIDNVTLTGQAKPAEENLHMQVISSEREDGSDVKQDAGSPNSDTQTVKSVSENISSTNLSEKNVLGQSMSDKNSDLFLVPIDGHTIDNKINQESIDNVTLTGQAKPAEENLHMQVIRSERKDGSDVKQDAGSPNSDTQTVKGVSENISSTNLSEKNVLGQSMSDKNSDLFLVPIDGHTIDNKINQESIDNVTLTGQAKPAEENLHMQVISSEREDGSDVKQDADSPNSDTQTVKGVSENISSTNLSEKNVLGQSMSDKNSDLFLVPIDGHTIDNKINQESIDNVTLTGQAKPAEENLHMQVISSEREDGSDVKQDADSPNSDTQTVKGVSENISSTNLSEKNVLGQSMSDKNSDLFLVPIDGHTIDNKINQESIYNVTLTGQAKPAEENLHMQVISSEREDDIGLSSEETQGKDTQSTNNKSNVAVTSQLICDLEDAQRISPVLSCDEEDIQRDDDEQVFASDQEANDILENNQQSPKTIQNVSTTQKYAEEISEDYSRDKRETHTQVNADREILVCDQEPDGNSQERAEYLENSAHSSPEYKKDIDSSMSIDLQCQIRSKETDLTIMLNVQAMDSSEQGAQTIGGILAEADKSNDLCSLDVSQYTDQSKTEESNAVTTSATREVHAEHSVNEDDCNQPKNFKEVNDLCGAQTGTLSSDLTISSSSRGTDTSCDSKLAKLFSDSETAVPKEDLEHTVDDIEEHEDSSGIFLPNKDTPIDETDNLEQDEQAEVRQDVHTASPEHNLHERTLLVCEQYSDQREPQQELLLDRPIETHENQEDKSCQQIIAHESKSENVLAEQDVQPEECGDEQTAENEAPNEVPSLFVAAENKIVVTFPDSNPPEQEKFSRNNRHFTGELSNDSGIQNVLSKKSNNDKLTLQVEDVQKVDFVNAISAGEITHAGDLFPPVSNTSEREQVGSDKFQEETSIGFPVRDKLCEPSDESMCDVEDHTVQDLSCKDTCTTPEASVLFEEHIANQSPSVNIGLNTSAMRDNKAINQESAADLELQEEDLQKHGHSGDLKYEANLSLGVSTSSRLHGSTELQCSMCGQKVKIKAGEKMLVVCHKCSQHVKSEDYSIMLETKEERAKLSVDKLKTESLSTDEIFHDETKEDMSSLHSDVKNEESESAVDKQYKCQKCDKAFRMPVLLASHMRCHTFPQCITCRRMIPIKNKTRRHAKKCTKCIMQSKERKIKERGTVHLQRVLKQNTRLEVRSVDEINTHADTKSESHKDVKVVTCNEKVRETDSSQIDSPEPSFNKPKKGRPRKIRITDLFLGDLDVKSPTALKKEENDVSIEQSDKKCEELNIKSSATLKINENDDERFESTSKCESSSNINKATAGKVYRCPKCDATFPLTVLLTRHMKSHRGARFQVCRCHLLLKNKGKEILKKCKYCRDRDEIEFNISAKKRLKQNVCVSDLPVLKKRKAGSEQHGKPVSQIKEVLHLYQKKKLVKQTTLGKIPKKGISDQKVPQKRGRKPKSFLQAMETKKDGVENPVTFKEDTNNKATDKITCADESVFGNSGHISGVAAEQVKILTSKPYKKPIDKSKFNQKGPLKGLGVQTGHNVTSSESPEAGKYTTQKPYICQECGKSFQFAKCLGLHIIIHTATKCESCGCRLMFKRRAGRRSKKCRVCRLKEKTEVTGATKTPVTTKKTLAHGRIQKESSIAYVSKSKKLLSKNQSGIKSQYSFEHKKLSKGVKKILLKGPLRETTKNKAKLLSLQKLTQTKRELKGINKNSKVPGRKKKVHADLDEPHTEQACPIVEDVLISPLYGTSVNQDDNLNLQTVVTKNPVKHFTKKPRKRLAMDTPLLKTKQKNVYKKRKSSVSESNKSQGMEIKLSSDPLPFTPAVEVNTMHTCSEPSHTAEQSFTCKLCLETFLSKEDLDVHVNKHDEERPFSCPDCNKRFVRRSDLSVHSRAHTGVRPYACPYCPCTFRQKASLVIHRYTHSHVQQLLAKTYPCDVCNEEFLEEKEFVIHQQIHTEERSFVCKYCGKKYCSEAKLAVHSKVHTGPGPFPCPICKRLFGYKANMVRHQILHTREKTFTCGKCNAQFPRRDILIRHKLTHGAEGEFSCRYCKKNFLLQGTLIKHLKICMENSQRESTSIQESGVKKRKQVRDNGLNKRKKVKDENIVKKRKRIKEDTETGEIPKKRKFKKKSQIDEKSINEDKKIEKHETNALDKSVKDEIKEKHNTEKANLEKNEHSEQETEVVIKENKVMPIQPKKRGRKPKEAKKHEDATVEQDSEVVIKAHKVIKKRKKQKEEDLSHKETKSKVQLDVKMEGTVIKTHKVIKMRKKKKEEDISHKEPKSKVQLDVKMEGAVIKTHKVIKMRKKKKEEDISHKEPKSKVQLDVKMEGAVIKTNKVIKMKQKQKEEDISHKEPKSKAQLDVKVEGAVIKTHKVIKMRKKKKEEDISHKESKSKVQLDVKVEGAEVVIKAPKLTKKVKQKEGEKVNRGQKKNKQSDVTEEQETGVVMKTLQVKKKIKTLKEGDSSHEESKKNEPVNEEEDTEVIVKTSKVKQKIKRKDAETSHEGAKKNEESDLSEDEDSEVIIKAPKVKPQIKKEKEQPHKTLKKNQQLQKKKGKESRGETMCAGEKKPNLKSNNPAKKKTVVKKTLVVRKKQGLLKEKQLGGKVRQMTKKKPIVKEKNKD